MKKADCNFCVAGAYFETLADAELAAKKYTSDFKQDYKIFQAISVAKAVVPDIKIEQITLN